MHSGDRGAQHAEVLHGRKDMGTFRSPTAPAADSKWPTCIFDAVMVTAQPSRARAEICRTCFHDNHESRLF